MFGKHENWPHHQFWSSSSLFLNKKFLILLSYKNYNQCITYNVQHAANKTGHLHDENNIIQRVHVLVLQCSHFHDFLEYIFKSIHILCLSTSSTNCMYKLSSLFVRITKRFNAVKGRNYAWIIKIAIQFQLLLIFAKQRP